MSNSSETKLVEFFNQYNIEDTDDNMTILSAATSLIYDKFKSRLTSEILGAMFIKTFDSILGELKSSESQYSDFRISVADRFTIGYNTNVNDEDEKAGNFMIFMLHNHKNHPITDFEKESNGIERCTQWCTDNIKEQPSVHKKIAQNTANSLKSIDISLSTIDLIFPFFIVTYDTLVGLLETKRRELDVFKYKINFLSCFTISAREGENGDEITITLNPPEKLLIKDDNVATARYE